MRAVLLLPLLTGLLTGCDRDPEDAVSISAGIYGVTVAGCDTSDCRDQRASDVRVTATGPGGEHETASESDGFYQLRLEPGDYEVCTYSCTRIVLVDRLRLDWISGPGGGIWCNAEGNCQIGG